MGAVKIQLSEEESRLLADPAIILTKNRVLEKLAAVLGAISEQQVATMVARRSELPAICFNYPPKISRGEKYGGLPWLVLDYPRVFETDEMMVIRQFMWWGNFFSSTLLVSGPLQQQVLHRLLNTTNADLTDALYICVHASPWEHNFKETNLLSFAANTREEWASLLVKAPFVKLAKKMPIDALEAIPAFLEKSFNDWLELISYPNDETGL
ncbi:MAG TPA: hypothetical protein PLQ65_00260 [Flavihumibacter sp.]|nr:hypothetical protein [Bacteroidota bacterium]HOA38667.1 hypothetical protein [Flavihumibacter sp.]HQD08063.1 hypothetical protein [Flavihumibacter sp.]